MSLFVSLSISMSLCVSVSVSLLLLSPLPPVKPPSLTGTPADLLCGKMNPNGNANLTDRGRQGPFALQRPI